MVSLWNGGLSDGNTSKRALENEHVVETQSHQVLKCPIGTESNEVGMQISLDHQETLSFPLDHNVSLVEKADGVKTAIKVEIQSDGLVGSAIGMVQDESLDDLVGKVVSMVTDEMDNEVKDVVQDVKPVDIEFQKDLERKSTKLLKEVKDQEVLSLVKLENGDSLSLVKKSEEGLKPLGKIETMVDSEVPHKDEPVGSPKDKFQRRRVFATRNFPKYCGRNAPPLTEAERLRITSGAESLVRSDSKKDFVKNDVLEISKDGVDTGELGKILPDRVEKGALQKMSRDDMEHNALGEAVASRDERIKVNVADNEFERRKMMSLPNKTSDAVIHKDCEERERSLQKEIVFGGPVKTVERRFSYNAFASEHEDEPVINAPMAAPHCPWRQGELALHSDVGKTGVKVKKGKETWSQKYKAVARRTVIKTDLPERPSVKKDRVSVSKDADGTPGSVVVRDENKYGAQFGGPPENSPRGNNTHKFGVLPHVGSSSSRSDARYRVRETLHLFRDTCRKLLEEQEAKFRSKEEAKSKKSEKIRRIDLEAAKIIKEKGKEVNVGMQCLGAVPGVEVGDKFQYRLSLLLLVFIRHYQAGIDYMKHNGMMVATSIVASGAYADELDNADVLIYSGQGGNVIGRDKQPEDQKLEKGNLALKNSVSAKNPVRVIRGSNASDSPESRGKDVMIYVYDGLYTVENYWKETGNHGKLVFMFELSRNPGQPDLLGKKCKTLV